MLRLAMIAMGLMCTAAAVADTPGGRLRAEAQALLLSDYVDEHLKVEDLDVSAVRGMMAGLNGGKVEGPNALLTPRALADLRGDLEGAVVGIGAHIDDKGGMIQIVAVLPGSGAEGADIQPGDRLLSIDGNEVKGSAAEVAAALRGEDGTTVRLSIVRGTLVLDKQVVRRKVAFPSLEKAQLGDVGLITLRYFNERTPAELEAALTALRGTGIRRLVLDMRGNGGGLFDKCIEAAELLVPRGATIVRTVGRGGKSRDHSSRRAPLMVGLPIAVLVDGQTASSAEILTEALRVDAQATVIGTRTFGKWRMEMVHSLSGGYALKFTVALLQSPRGQNFDGKGLAPDLEIPASARPLEQLRRMTDLAQRAEVDPPFKGALHLLRLRGG
jgi:carboxyl-terminal processing protease